jgi:hypothetical protein
MVPPCKSTLSFNTSVSMLICAKLALNALVVFVAVVAVCVLVVANGTVPADVVLATLATFVVVELAGFVVWGAGLFHSINKRKATISQANNKNVRV